MSLDRDKLRHQKIEIKMNQKFKKFISNKSLSGGGGGGFGERPFLRESPADPKGSPFGTF